MLIGCCKIPLHSMTSGKNVLRPVNNSYFRFAVTLEEHPQVNGVRTACPFLRCCVREQSAVQSREWRSCVVLPDVSGLEQT